MPPRQYYCWKLCLKFNCGCMEYTSTQHVCNSNKGVQCNKWMITRSTDKDCDSHRINGLHGGSEGSSSTDERDQSGGQSADDPIAGEQRRVQEESHLASGSWEQGPRRRAAE